MELHKEVDESHKTHFWKILIYKNIFEKLVLFSRLNNNF